MKSRSPNEYQVVNEIFMCAIDGKKKRIRDGFENSFSPNNGFYAKKINVITNHPKKKKKATKKRMNPKCLLHFVKTFVVNSGHKDIEF